MSYVDGFLLPLPKAKIVEYKKMSKKASKIWMKHGALEYRECVGDDLTPPWALAFPKLMKLKDDEAVIFAWIVYKSKAHRDRVNKKVMSDPQMNADMEGKQMPFDVKKMAYGGFKTIVEVLAK
jgi:alkaline phosphatase